ncbi:MAG TPA: phosphoenolpyruvate--protein phosphotransferase [Actinomycetales bacterium]|nr:phosphoenolpyruvate--protein phosphotransferase [Actinomycetales bacterium]
MASGQVLKGTGVGRGSVVAPAVLMPPSPVVSEFEAAGNPETAIERVKEIMAEVGASLRAQAERSSTPLADMLAAAATMAEDPTLTARIIAIIHSGTGPATAVDEAVNHYADSFRAAGGHLAERVTDLMSVRDRIVAKILGLPEPGVPNLTEPRVICAQDLSPADTAALDLDHAAAIVTEKGGPTSHAAIIAAQLGIPCVVGVTGILEVAQGATLGINAVAGQVIVHPSEQEKAALTTRAKELADLTQGPGPGITKDGHKIEVLANIGTVGDAIRARETQIEGVGLFRTEIPFLRRQTAPTVDEEVETYSQVFASFRGQKVIVRTLDVGADKPLAFANLPQEENPALGIRGYRIDRVHPQLLTDQLSALARAAKISDGETWVMAPMVATAAEAREFAVRARAAGIKTVGVMIEVPSAALSCDQILAEVDFLSIGTNDLAQYTMAADRLSAELVDLTDQWQPAILELIARTAAAGKKHGKPVGVCGESAADPIMALVLTGMGITSLSMAAPAAVGVRYLLAQHTLGQCEEMAQVALTASGAQEARDAVLNLVDHHARATLGL